jgi:hypothetical protein
MKITIGEIRQAISGMDDRLPIIVRRGGEFDDPSPVHVRRVINALVLEVDDELSEDYLTLERSHAEEVDKLDAEVQSLKNELAKIKEAAGAAILA